MDKLRESERQQKLVAEAQWVWPALCITTLWGLGLLLSLPWLTTWLGAAQFGLSALVVPITLRVRRSAVSAAQVGGAVFLGLGLGAWILVLTVFHLY